VNTAVKLPPYADALGATLEWQDGAPVLVMPFGDDVLGRPGFLHGGALAGLMEVAAIAALRHALAAEGEDPAPRIKPVNVTVDFMRGGREKDTRAAGIVTRLGTRVANVEAVAWQDDRAKPIAAARMNYLIARA
jgi:uncharacterized protein (TIGR00369 family)